MDLSVGPVSDNSISSTRPVHCDIDKLVNEIEELNDEFADHLYSIIKLRSRCEKLIEKLRELKGKNLEVGDDIGEKCCTGVNCRRSVRLNVEDNAQTSVRCAYSFSLMSYMSSVQKSN